MEKSERLKKIGPAEKLMEVLSEADVTVYAILNPSNIIEARTEFLSSPAMPKPDFEYGNLNRNKIEKNIQALDAASVRVPSVPLSKTQRMAADLVLSDLYDKNNFVLACDDYNQANSPEEKAEAKARQQELNERLYGLPNKETFYCLMGEELSKIDIEALDSEDKDIYDDLVAGIGEIPEAENGRFRPKVETVRRFSEMINLLYSSFFKHIPEDKGSFTPAEACKVANEIIFEEIGAAGTEYRAIMDDDISNVSVDHKTRTIRFPTNRAAGNFSRDGLKAILAHELGTHAYRAMNYEQSDVPVLSSELPGNEEIDEGIAKCCEQAVCGKYQDSGIPHYINIGLACLRGKNFREVFEIQRRLRYLQGCRPGETDSEKGLRFTKANPLVFNQAMRCFRGTGELPNCKDLVYYNGANRVWRYIEDHIDDPWLLETLFLSGKSDFTNPEQEWLVYESKMGK